MLHIILVDNLVKKFCFRLQDFKLNLLRWHLLPNLARLLCQLAALLRAWAYVDHYQRDMGPSIASDIPLPNFQGKAR